MGEKDFMQYITILDEEKDFYKRYEARLKIIELFYNSISKDKITDKIKELEDLFDKNEKEITIQYQNQFIVDVVGVLEDLLKEN